MVSYPKDAPMSDADCTGIILQPQLGRGTARIVYAVVGDPDAVIKKVHLPFVGPNFVEWQMWQRVKHTKFGSLFGECLAISMTGRFLIMERLDDITQSDWPNTPSMPVWLQDLNPTNFGKNTNGEIKVRDYATVQISSALAAAPTRRWAWQGH